jgi:hypothetical protein
MQTRPMARKKMMILPKIQMTGMITYTAEDNEDTELTIAKTYQDDLIPFQGDLLNTEIAKPTITLIQKQEIGYHPKIVLMIPKDPQTNQLTLLAMSLS